MPRTPGDHGADGFEAALRGVPAPPPPRDLLPRCLPAADALPTPMAGETLAPRPLALVVDDEPHIRQLVRIHLEAAGCAVEEAGDGAAGVSLAGDLRPEIVVLDVLMPRLDGFGALARLKSEPETASILVLMLTAQDRDDDIRRGWGYGADFYLPKPFNPRELRSVVERMLAVRGTPEEPAPFRPWRK